MMRHVMTSPLLRPVAAAVLASCVLVGCNLAPRFEAPAVALPTAVSGVPAADATLANAPALGEASRPLRSAEDDAALVQWLEHEGLRAVAAQALAHNRDLRVAIDNIEKARAQYGITRADLLPSVNAQLQASRSRNSADLANNGQSSISEQYTAQLGFASFELDFWGRIRNLSDAALQQFLQTSHNTRSVQLALVAEVSQAWLALGADMGRLALARETLASREEGYALIQRMFELGATTGLVVAQNLSTVETARGDVALYTAQVQKSLNALQLLAGGAVPPQHLPNPDLLRSLQASISPLQAVPEALPSSALLVRPDVQAAEHALRAMNANIGAARAAFFPSISLTGNVGSGSRELDNLLGAGTNTWSFAPQIRLPIFSGGRNRAALQVAEANERIAVAQYEKTVQTAFREVADVLADRSQWGARLGAQQGVMDSTATSLKLSEARFKAGVDNYLTVLDAQRSLYSAQQSMISLRFAEQTNRITLWKVLGGTLAPLAPLAPLTQPVPPAAVAS